MIPLLCQINPIVGDLKGNARKILEASQQVSESDLAVFPECAVCGYPPLDLLDWPTFVSAVESVNAYLIEQSANTLPMLFGTIYREDGKLRNGAILASGGVELGRQAKRLLPTYDVFDERRYFESAAASVPIQLDGCRLGIMICEDAWTDKDLWPDCPYQDDPTSDLVEAGCDLLINISASPYEWNKPQWREKLFGQLAKKHQTPLIHVNQVGANDELLFMGGSMSFDRSGHTVGRLPLTHEQCLVSDSQCDWEDTQGQLLEALKLGLKDYIHKNGFTRVVLGLSGGVDSALVAALAVSALGSEQVVAVAMPGPYSSDHSLSDARTLAEVLGIKLEVCSIEEMFQAVESLYQHSLSRPLEGLARQNTQARCRGQIIMNLANSLGAMVLNTSNKSELAVGYSTLAGDLCGSLSPIGDLTKQQVYSLLSQLKENSFPEIPQSIFDKAPSAELAPDQLDTDNLPAYEDLDQLVEDYVMGHLSPQEMVKGSLTEKEVFRWLRTIDRNEYKRRQSPTVLRVSSKSFGLGRRRPIAQGFDPEWRL